MDIEFHYYMTGIIAKYAGFSEYDAKIIAYSSQFVDDNDVILQIKDRKTHQIYSNYISQTMDILKPKKALMRIYPVFHFVPGEPMCESARRVDGKMHMLNTIPDNEIANDLLSKAMTASSDIRPYRIGVASHPYVDTWAHQNFAGFDDSFNGDVLNPIPNIGHAEARHHPDWVSHRWQDDRLVEQDIDNNLRFLTAAKRLFENYAGHTGSDAQWPELEDKLIAIMGRSRRGDQNYGREDRIAKYHSGDGWLPPYNEDDWFDNAIEREVHGLKDSGGLLSRLTLFKDEYFWKEGVTKENTDWYKFQEAVKEHQTLAMVPVSKLVKTMGVDLRAI